MRRAFAYKRCRLRLVPDETDVASGDREPHRAEAEVSATRSGATVMVGTSGSSARLDSQPESISFPDTIKVT